MTSDQGELFKSRLRTRLEAQRVGETTYQFINDSAWEACDAYRDLVNGWLAGFPPSDRVELTRRIRTARDDFKYHAAMLEVVTGALLQGLGYSIDPHPSLTGTRTTPDFAVSEALGGRVGYVEATATGLSVHKIAAGKRQKPIYNAIDHISMPTGCFLGFKLLAAGGDSPPLGELRRDVQQWVDRECNAVPAAPLKKIFRLDDWEVELKLFRTESGKDYQNAIHVTGPYVGWISPIEDIRSKLSEKSKRYGRLDWPYVIVVGDTHGRSWGTGGVASDLSQAVFGDEVLRWSETAEPTWGRASNGFWLGPKGVRNTHVSAVLFFPDVGIWGLRNFISRFSWLIRGRTFLCHRR